VTLLSWSRPLLRMASASSTRSNGVRSINKFTIGTFNVRGLSSQSKRQQVVDDARNYNLDVCCLQETKSPLGDGFVISRRMRESLSRCWAVSDRVAVAQFSVGKKYITIINVYAPTSTLVANSPTCLDEFYNSLNDTVLDVNSSSMLLFIAGDFNAKLGKSNASTQCTGRHGRGRRNYSGLALAEFCEAHQLFAANTAFQHPARHITTWTGFRRSNAGVLVISKLLLPEIFKLSSSRRKVAPTGFEVNRLSSSAQVQQDFKNKVAEGLITLDEESPSTASQPRTSSSLWRSASEVIIKAGEESVGRKEMKRPPRHGWDDEIKDLSERMKALRLRIIACSDVMKRKSLQTERNQVSHALRRRAKECASDLLDKKIQEIERLKDSAQMFKAVSLLGRERQQAPVVATTTLGVRWPPAA